MTLVPCLACKAPISAAAAACPHCGHPVTPRPTAPRTHEQRLGASKRTTIAIAIPFLVAVVFIIGAAITSSNPPPAASGPAATVGSATSPAKPAAQIAIERGQHMLDLMTKPGDQWPPAGWFDQALQGLRAIPADAPEHGEATRVLAAYETHHAAWEAAHEAAVAKRNAADQEALEDGRRTLRGTYGKHLEEVMLSRGFNVDVLVEGQRRDRLKIKYALASKVTAYQLTHSDLPHQWQSLGFRKVTLTDGYDQSFVWNF